jgi:SsrA-binding protein
MPPKPTTKAGTAKPASPKGKKSGGKTIAVNRRASYEYALDDVFEAGIVLTGTEVKSLRLGRANIEDSYASHKHGEIWWINGFIPEYAQGNRHNHEPKRLRKLLLHKKQVSKLIGQLKVQGTTLVPLKLYFNSRGVAKLEIAIAKGKKEYEKRDAIKEREWKRQKDRLLRK